MDDPEAYVDENSRLAPVSLYAELKVKFEKYMLNEMKKTDEEFPLYPTHFGDIEIQNDEVTKGYNFELHLGGKFLHYRAATNWHSNWRDSNDPLFKKTEIFNTIIGELLK